MRQFGLSILFLLFVAPFASAQQCNCDPPPPWKPNPPCFNVCATTLLAGASFEELQKVFGLRPESAAKVLTWENRRTAKSLEDFRTVLDLAEITLVSTKINSLNKRQLKYLHESAKKRDKLAGLMGAIF